MDSIKSRQYTGRAAIVTKYAFLILLAAIFILPLFWVLKSSFQTAANIKRWPPQWIPDPWTLDHYVYAFDFLPLLRFALNSLIVAVMTATTNIIFCSLSGYTLARKRFFGRDAIFFLIVSTMMIPFHIRLIPMYTTAVNLGWLNTYIGQVFPIAIMGYGVFMMRQFFSTLPREVEDAAHIDGCGNWGTVFRIVIPMAKPSIVSLALFSVVASFEDFLWPMIITTRTEMRPLPTGITMFAGRVIYEWGPLMAACAVTIFPLLLLFILLQEQLVHGVTAGAVKE